jgi:predicted transcriptional regulator
MGTKRVAKTAVPRGGLQDEVMAAIWKLRRASVEDVRAQLPRPDLAYTTVHTVLSRLVQRGLIKRESEGAGLIYSPRLEEAEHIARSFSERLTATSSSVRTDALRSLVDRLDAREVEGVARYANRIRRERSKD